MKEDFCLWLTRLLILTMYRGCLTSKTRNGRVRFAVVGDTGGIGYWPFSKQGQRALSQKLAKVPNVDFFLGVGDNFYWSGVRNVYDFRFFYSFEKVYNSSSLFKDWYMIAGNHDYAGNISAQILYSKLSKRWNFPHNFYTKVFNIPNSNKTLQIVMIDTMALCFGHWRFVKRKITPEVVSSQMDWLTHTLENSNASYLVVSGHHTMYSAGWHGPTKCIQDKLEKLFEKHKITAYFCGHDHNLQHIKKENSAVEYFVSGAGTWNDRRYYANMEPNSLKQFYGKSVGFLIVTATDKFLKVKFRSLDGKSRYRRIILPREQKTNNTKFPKLLKEFFHSVEMDGVR